MLKEVSNCTRKARTKMSMTSSEIELIVAELTRHLSAHKDGSGKNLICRCPYCNKDGKFGIYIGAATGRKKPLMSHCFSCGRSNQDINYLLADLGRADLFITKTTDIAAELNPDLLFPLDVEEEIDDELSAVTLPEYYKRSFSLDYLKGRGFQLDDYEYFPVGTTLGMNHRYKGYVIFPIIDGGRIVGYVSRHQWSKQEIDAHNRQAKRNGEYQIRRFNNSMENDFIKLLYNYDAVKDGKTKRVIIVEGIFDVVALNRKLELYDDCHTSVVATFGKKISHVQIYKLQNKGVREVVIGFDGDAVEVIKKIATELSSYFKVLIADITDPDKDWEDLTLEEVQEIFECRLKTPIDYKLTKIQL